MAKTKWFLTSVIVLTFFSSPAFAQNPTPEGLVYPNPTTNGIIKLATNVPDGYTFQRCEIYSILGNKLTVVATVYGNEFAFEATTFWLSKELHIDGPEGIYFAKFIFDNEAGKPKEITKKIIYSSSTVTNGQ